MDQHEDGQDTLVCFKTVSGSRRIDTFGNLRDHGRAMAGSSKVKSSMPAFWKVMEYSHLGVVLGVHQHVHSA